MSTYQKQGLGLMLSGLTVLFAGPTLVSWAIMRAWGKFAERMGL